MSAFFEALGEEHCAQITHVSADGADWIADVEAIYSRKAPAGVPARHRRGPDALEAWIGWARRCRIPAFVELQERIVKHKAAIFAAIEHGLSNDRIESVNTKIRPITRIAFGFRADEALI